MLPGLASPVGNDKSTTVQRSCNDPAVRNDVSRNSPVLLSKTFLNIQRYTPITVDQTAPFQNRKISIDLVSSWLLIRQVEF